MPETYDGAVITIAATKAENAEEGFLINQLDHFPYTEEKFVLPARFNGSDGSVYVGIPASPAVMSGVSWLVPQPLDLRAWTFQESLLCRRSLQFTVKGVHWECQKTMETDSNLRAGTLAISFHLSAGSSRIRHRWEVSI
jgi:hypothetical protein